MNEIMKQIIEDVKIDDNLININEAFFTKGLDRIKRLEDSFQELLDRYNSEYKDKDSRKDFNNFIKDDAFKKLEASIIEIFGVRSVEVFPMVMNNLKRNELLNAFTYTGLNTRFVIDGLITNEGFYDKTHTLITLIYISKGLFKKCNARQMVALFLHEFGHNIDPKLAYIQYEGDDQYVDYLTGKNKNVKTKDKKKSKLTELGEFLIFYIVYVLIIALPSILKFLFSFFRSDENKLKKLKKDLNRMKLMMTIDKHTEAYADNLARMYGYGSDLISALQIIGDNNEGFSLSKWMKLRHKQLIDMTISSIRDVHGTDMQRTRALIKEYEKDLQDPNIPKEIKKIMQEDMDELNKIYEMYTKTPDKFRNKINELVKNKLEKEYTKEEKKENK